MDVADPGEGVARLRLFGSEVEVPAHPNARAGRRSLLVRPESLVVREVGDGPDSAEPDALGTITATIFMGDRVDYEVEWRGQRLIAMVADPDERRILPEGTTVALEANLPRTWLLPD